MASLHSRLQTEKHLSEGAPNMQQEILWLIQYLLPDSWKKFFINSRIRWSLLSVWEINNQRIRKEYVAWFNTQVFEFSKLSRLSGTADWMVIRPFCRQSARTWPGSGLSDGTLKRPNNQLKVNFTTMKNMPFSRLNHIILFVIFSVCCFSAGQGYSFKSLPTNDCPTPSVNITGHSPGNIAFEWASVGSGAYYKVWYVRRDDNFRSADITTNNNSISFSGLSAGSYEFYFVTVCSNGLSEIVIIDEIILWEGHSSHRIFLRVYFLVPGSEAQARLEVIPSYTPLLFQGARLSNSIYRLPGLHQWFVACPLSFAATFLRCGVLLKHFR